MFEVIIETVLTTLLTDVLPNLECTSSAFQVMLVDLRYTITVNVGYIYIFDSHLIFRMK